MRCRKLSFEEGFRVAFGNERAPAAVIERGERHEVRNDGDAPLRTLNFHTPPAY